MKAASGVAGLPPTSHLDRLEAESIHIIREVVAEARNPVFLYSVGKDSSVMLHLAAKAFYPSPPPFPFLHVESGWDFQALLAHRDAMVERYRLELIVARNENAAQRGVDPFTTPATLYSELMLIEPLTRTIETHRFDATLGGARRDEEKSRAKERVFSFRSASHSWDPRQQRPELWNLYNAHLQRGESLRVFPLSNWTELDIWHYILREDIPIVPLYLAASRQTIWRNDLLLMIDDDRMRLLPGEQPRPRMIRFRTLGCYPLTGAVESRATSIVQVIQETLVSRGSEREGRAVDHDQPAAMEKKKQAGYF